MGIHQENVTDLYRYLGYLAKYLKYPKSNGLGQVGWVNLAKYQVLGQVLQVPVQVHAQVHCEMY
ncbi:hypothetical protein BD310DRAFT_882306 [Dichomitus squalens]|uniref:Uncharacterized protein n=1 Tax=Dichomitus squalens TaxID=114155 RepID=A0A4Q9PQM8_9APHY|nr:hypothetical protein BD310DRAFT_882306 [Dichomitus squalens]